MFNEHPFYTANIQEWEKYRKCFEGGQDFINLYLTKFSPAESDENLRLRRTRAYLPAFSKGAIYEIRNTIAQRLSDVSRIGGSLNYKNSCEFNVDRKHNSMNSFMSEYVIPELLVMSKVAVYVDSNKLQHGLQTESAKPYLYYYRCEDIINWSYNENNELVAVTLREWYTEQDENTSLVTGYKSRIRNVFRNKKDGKIYVQIDGVTQELALNNFPVILLEISESLLTDVANHQIALLNLASSDVQFCLQANIPLYVEPYNVMAEASLNQFGEQASKMEIGVTKGRRYPDTADAPSFINPSTEPLEGSMKKQEQIKTEIRQLMTLSIANLKSTWASADSKAADKESESNGLAVIGRELQRAENLIGSLWSEYEGVEPPTIIYPTDYQLKPRETYISQAEQYLKLMKQLPSKTYQRELAKVAARTVLTGTVKSEVLSLIEQEINEAKSLTSDPDTIAKDIKNGLVGNELASELRGYPAGEVNKAKMDHAEKLSIIQEYQSGSAIDPTSPTGRSKDDESITESESESDTD